ncbi:Hsp70 family protein [Virgisporangium aurantiacum]|nr:Hsp70 family protein [Virgisporangium aurantiacum]
MWAVGIDLGTSNTVAILRSPDGRTRPVLFDGQPVLPSAVYLDHDGTLRVGTDAQRMAPLDPARFEPNPKRRIDEESVLLGDRPVPIVDLLAAPLREIARSVTVTAGHLPPAVLTCPVAWGPIRRERLQRAAAAAGWPAVRVLPEPIAAARYFTLSRPIPPGGTLAIFDFGGGTLDVALVRNDGATFTVVGTGGAEDLGGLDIDAAVVAHLGHLLAARHPEVWTQLIRPADELARRHRKMFWDDVRAAKETLSRATTAPIPVPGVSASLHLTRDELDQVAAPLLNRATGELTAALHRARLTPDRLAGIFLVGGTSRVPWSPASCTRTPESRRRSSNNRNYRSPKAPSPSPRKASPHLAPHPRLAPFPRIRRRRAERSRWPRIRHRSRGTSGCGRGCSAPPA